MSRALNVGVIITLRQGLNQHQTLASGGGRTTQKEPRLFNSLSLSLVIYLSLSYNSRLQLPNRCLVAGIPPISFTMVTSGIKVGGQGARTGLEFHCGHKTNKNKSFFNCSSQHDTMLRTRAHARAHTVIHISSNLIQVNRFSAPVRDSL